MDVLGAKGMLLRIPRTNSCMPRNQGQVIAFHRQRVPDEYSQHWAMS
jgi:hypothetical protein